MSETDDQVKITIIREARDVYQIVPKLMSARAVEVDTETTGLDPLNDRVRLIQFGLEDEVFVIDTWATGPDVIRDCFAAFFSSTSVLKIYMNADFDLRFLSSNFGFRHRRIYDIYLASKVLSNGISAHTYHHSLAAIAKRYLNVELDKTEQRSDWSADVLTDSQLEYAGNDVSIMRRIMQVQIRLLQKYGLVDTVRLENNAIVAVARMELDGVYVQPEMWSEMITELTVEYLEATRKLKLAFGLPNINLNSTQQVKKALAAGGIVVESTNSKILQPLARQHPVVALLLNYRGISKLLSTYGYGVPGAKRKKNQVFFLERINPRTGRIHPNFILVGPETGRMACEKPNVQNVVQIGKAAFRQCFIGQINPATGKRNKIIVCDFSAVELRILAHLSGDANMRQAIIAGGDLHVACACLMFGVTPESIIAGRDPITGEKIHGPNYWMRSASKSISFGLIYGRGAKSLAEQLGVSIQEAKGYMQKYFSIYSSIATYLQDCADTAVRTRQCRTFIGRIRHFEFEWTDSAARSSVEREGKNTPVQGGNSEILKYALYLVHTALDDLGYTDMGVKMVNAVHDGRTCRG